jgi:YaiO family outer membrane protein
VRSLAAAAVLLAAGAARGGEIEVGYGHDHVSGGRPAWRAASLEVRLARADGARVAFSARDLERFGLRDRELALAAGAPWRGRWLVSGEASGSLSPSFAPAFTAAVGLERALGRGFAASARVRWAHYEGGTGTADPLFASAGVERYFGAQRLAATGYLASLGGALSASARLAWDLYYGERSRIGVALAGGRELESTGASGPLATDVLSGALAGSHAAGEAWAVLYEVGVSRQGDLYTRAGARLGLARRF